MEIVRVSSLHKRYGETVAVDDVSFAVEEGEIFGILGPNGAGKTTTVECVSGLRRPDAGTVEVVGLDPVADRDRVRQVVGVQLQEARLPDSLRVGEAVELYASFYPDPQDTSHLLHALGLTAKRSTAFGDLSGGQQQRLSIALALVGRPRVAVLDELTTGLDPHARRETWQLVEAVRDAGVTVILVSHVMEEAERLCDRIAVIDRGRLVALDTPEGLVSEVAGNQRIRFRADARFDAGGLTTLPEVVEVTNEGRWTVVSGTDNLAVAVSRALDAQGVSATDLRVEPATLDDAFLALTGRIAGEPAADVGTASVGETNVGFANGPFTNSDEPKEQR